MPLTGQSKARPAQRRSAAPHAANRAVKHAGGVDLGSARPLPGLAAEPAGIVDTESVSVEWRPLRSLHPLIASWQTLAARAVEPNVFYEPAFALAAGPIFGNEVTVALVWSSEARRLVGLFPFCLETRRYGAKLPLLAAWTHPFAPLGVPLVDRDNPAAVIAALLNNIANADALPKLLLFPFITPDGAFATAFHTALESRGGRVAEFGRHARALLAPVGDRSNYLAQALGTKRRKELARQRRRLAESAQVVFDSADEFAKVMPALRDFITLEAQGWKGRAGSAAAQQHGIRTFIENAVTALASENKATVIRLTHGSRTIAAGIVLRSGQGAWFWKIAYDEMAAKASPGTQLALDLTEAMLREPDLAFVDSCATADHPMIDHLWRERLSVADWLVTLHPSGGVPFALVRAFETLRREAIAAAKRARDLVRRH